MYVKPGMKERAIEQLDNWVQGRSIHNTEDDMCCPDMSCCLETVRTSNDKRVAFRDAFLNNDLEVRERLLKEFGVEIVRARAESMQDNALVDFCKNLKPGFVNSLQIPSDESEDEFSDCYDPVSGKLVKYPSDEILLETIGIEKFSEPRLEVSDAVSVTSCSLLNVETEERRIVLLRGKLDSPRALAICILLDAIPCRDDGTSGELSFAAMTISRANNPQFDDAKWQVFIDNANRSLTLQEAEQLFEIQMMTIPEVEFIG